MHDAEAKKAMDARLARIEGQVRAVRRMIGEDEACEDIAQQLAAARKALDRAFYEMVSCMIRQEPPAGNAGAHRARGQGRRAAGAFRVMTHTYMEAGTHTMNFDKELDARGLNCPLPILRAKKALNDMQSRAGAEDRLHRSGVGEGLPGVRQADRQRAAVAGRRATRNSPSS